MLACKRLEKKEKKHNKSFSEWQNQKVLSRKFQGLGEGTHSPYLQNCIVCPSHNLMTDETAFKPACYRLAHTRRAQISAYQRSLDSTFSCTCDCIKGDNSTSMTAFLLGSLLLTTHEYGLSLSLSLSPQQKCVTNYVPLRLYHTCQTFTYE